MLLWVLLLLLLLLLLWVCGLFVGLLGLLHALVEAGVLLKRVRVHDHRRSQHRVQHTRVARLSRRHIGTVHRAAVPLLLPVVLLMPWAVLVLVVVLGGLGGGVGLRLRGLLGLRREGPLMLMLVVMLMPWPLVVLVLVLGRGGGGGGLQWLGRGLLGLRGLVIGLSWPVLEHRHVRPPTQGPSAHLLRPPLLLLMLMLVLGPVGVRLLALPLWPGLGGRTGRTQRLPIHLAVLHTLLMLVLMLMLMLMLGPWGVGLLDTSVGRPLGGSPRLPVHLRLLPVLLVLVLGERPKGLPRRRLLLCPLHAVGLLKRRQERGGTRPLTGPRQGAHATGLEAVGPSPRVVLDRPQLGRHVVVIRHGPCPLMLTHRPMPP